MEPESFGRSEISQPGLITASKLLFHPPSKTNFTLRRRKRRSHNESFVPISGEREKKYFAFIRPVFVMFMTSLERSVEALTDT